ncbi:hematopoietic SH2 domain-containing protein homolog isoform 1-T2 [Aulostomus maculatus]
MEIGLPFTRQPETFSWFTESQFCSKLRNGTVPEWFHGNITRNASEQLLMSKPPGYFLIRLSESRIGYTLSYRAADRCRHFMIDALQDGYFVIVGENMRHRFLQDLVDFHRRTPILPFSEVLTVACGQATNGQTDYAEILFPQRGSSPQALCPSVNQPIKQECIPPVVPDRTPDMSDSADPHPHSQVNKLYAHVEDESSQDTSPVPLVPVPKTRTKYLQNPPADQPPELPAQSSVKMNQASIKTVSAPESPPAASDWPVGAPWVPVKTKEAGSSVLKNFKKKFQRRRSSQHMYAEINKEAEQTMEGANRGANVENECHEIPDKQASADASLSWSGAAQIHRELPQEYLHPPPFAPGYWL